MGCEKLTVLTPFAVTVFFVLHFSNLSKAEKGFVLLGW